MSEQREIRHMRPKQDASARTRLLQGRARPSSGGGGTGEGSRGGVVIGRTSSGKPIYKNHGHPSHKEFSSTDHKEAAVIHSAEESKFKEFGQKQQGTAAFQFGDIGAGHGKSKDHHLEQAKKKAIVTPQVQGLGESLGGKSGLAMTGKQNVKGHK